MILDDAWKSWCRRHSQIFALTSEADASMLLAWRDVLGVSGYSVAELEEATTWLAAHAPPRFRSDHLAALIGRIGRQRRERAKHNDRNAEHDHGIKPHDLCGGSGWAIVPHFRSVIDGEWCYPWYELAVLCTCAKGVRIGSTRSLQNKPQPMSLERYQALNLDWMRQTVWRREQKQAELKAMGFGLAADRAADRRL